MIEEISSKTMWKKRKMTVGKTAEPKRKVIVTNILNLTEVWTISINWNDTLLYINKIKWYYIEFSQIKYLYW